MSRGKKILTVPPGEEEASWQAVLDDYLAFLRGCGRSKSTVELYRDQVSRFYGAANYSLGVGYRLNPAVEFELAYDAIDYGDNNPTGLRTGDDNIIRFPTFVTF